MSESSPFGSPGVKLEVGQVIKHDGRVWRVGLVNDSRARLDPITGRAVIADPVSGRSFQSYGQSVNITPHAIQFKDEEVDLSELDEEALNRLVRLQERADDDAAHGRNTGVRRYAPTLLPDEEDSMDTAGQTVTKADRIAQLRAAKAAQAGKVTKTAAAPVKGSAAVKPPVGKATAKPAKAAKAKGSAARTNDCMCGCGGKTASYFVPGHDARFKGWLSAIAKGKGKPKDIMPEKVAAAYQWRNSGEGMVPTKNYKGEPYA